MKRENIARGICTISMFFVGFLTLLKAQSVKNGTDDCKGYVIKSDSVFLFDEYIRFADPTSFRCIEGEYARDKNAVFFGKKKLKDADPVTFVVLEYGYSKDKDRVYFDYSDKIIAGADPKTFVVYDLPISKDKNAVYYLQKIGGKIKKVAYANAATFKEKNGYFYDMNYLFNLNMEIVAQRDTFDVDSFLSPR